MYEGRDPAIAALLRERSHLPAETLASLGEACRATGRPLARLVVDQGILGRSELVRLVAEALGLAWTEALPTTVDGAAGGLVPPELARRFGVVPLRADAASVDVATMDPFRPGLATELAFVLGRQVRLVVADPAAVARVLDQVDGEGTRTGAGGESAGEEELRRMAEEAPIVRLVERVLEPAVEEKASDIHFEPFENEFKVRVRVDGTLRDAATLPPRLALPVVSRVKVLAGLNIAERRAPQDGRIRLVTAGRPVDLRVSTLPTQFGESVVLRVLDRGASPPGLSELGMSAAVETAVRAAVQRPSGLVLVTGPTGSGKTTTLYSCLRILNEPEVKILTAEDPVEYEIEGVMQLPVQPAIGLTFAAALRAFLRQDPDVLMVGEIRDLETAQIAIQAALTGHLVLSTLHTNDAAGAIARLVDMGVEPFLLSATLEAVLAQRLVRCVCPDCSEPYIPESSGLQSLGCESDVPGAAGFRRGRGCGRCHGTGYRGRTGIFEWLPMRPPLRDLVLRRASAVVIRQQAISLGMETLRAAGLRAVVEGRTTVEEVARCT